MALVTCGLGACASGQSSAPARTVHDRGNVRFTALPASIDPATGRLIAVVVMENMRDLPSAVTFSTSNCHLQIELFSSARREPPPVWTQKRLGIACAQAIEIVTLDTLGSEATLRSAVPLDRIMGDSLAAGTYYASSFVRVGDGGGFRLSAGTVSLP